MRTLFLICFISQFINSAFSQSYKIYYLDKDLFPAEKNKAVIIGKGSKDSTLFKLDCYNAETFKHFMSVHFIDSSISVLQGTYRSFYPSGLLEEKGDYEKEMRAGVWYKWDSEGHMSDSIVYSGGKTIYSANYSYYENGKISSFKFTDSINDIARFTYYDSTGRLMKEADFKGNRGVVNNYKEGEKTTISVSQRDETEANVAGGTSAFGNYLRRNLRSDTPLRRGARAGTYSVVVKFIVNTDGKISDVIPETDFGYGMEEEVIRIIKQSPRWKPALQFGIPIKAYRRQPVTFVVAEN